MRIAMISEHASPLAALGGVDAGGQNVHVAALATALAARGHGVSVYTRRDSRSQPERQPLCPGVEVVHVPAGPPRSIPKDSLYPYMPAFGRWLADEWGGEARPDVVHAHFWMSGLAALEARRATGVPTVQTFHALGVVKRRHQGGMDTSPATRVADETMLARDVDLVVATCTDEVAELRRLGAPAARITVVPCGVDTTHFSPDGASFADQPAHRGMAFRLLCLGRMVERKGVDTVVRALTGLPGCELLVAGGPAVDRLDGDPEVVRLRRLAADLGVLDRVRFIGRVDHGAVPALIRSADVVVATPWYEPFGIVPLEAMACGRPLVGSAVGGLLDSVQNGVTGLLVPPRDTPAVVRAVRSLLRDPALRTRLGTAARRRAVERFDWGTVASQTEQCYQAVTGATSRLAVRAL